MVNKWIIYQYIKQYIYTGWWLTYPSEKYELVSWDYDSQYMGKKCSKPKPLNIYKSLQKTCVSASYNPPFMAKNDQPNFPNHLVCPVSPGLWGDKCG